MKKLLSAVILIIFFANAQAQVMDSTWFRPRQLIHQPMPAINGTTIQGEKVDAKFFDGNVVLLAFCNLINVASLKDIEILNQLQRDFQGHSFKILSILPNAKQDVVDFNADSTNTGLGRNLRSTFQLPAMEYPVLATCDQRNADNTLHIACDNVVKDFLIGGYPVICMVDKNHIIRYMHVGLPPKEEIDKWYDTVSNQIGLLLKE